MSKNITNGIVPTDKVLSFDDSGSKPKISFDVNVIQKSPSDQSVTSQTYSNILKSVGKKIRKTKAELDRSGWIHGFYILALVMYSAVGGALFCALDGAESDKVIQHYNNRCVDMRETLWNNLTSSCKNISFEQCQNETRRVLLTVDHCLRSIDRNITVYSTANYLNSLIYAITVVTTIGYGTISVSSTAGRAATIVYTVVGTPLFFAFLNDMGQWFQRLFLLVYVKLRRLLKVTSLFKTFFQLKFNSRIACEYDDSPSRTGLIFTSAVIFLILYFLMVSTMFSLIERWNFFDSFYFVFQSISLIGFGDVFPDHPNTVLFTITFIIVGISLLSMCFFILQEWIREKTSRLSNRFRYSVRHWRETHHFPLPHYHRTSHSLWSLRNSSRRNSAIPERRHKISITTPNSVSASRENSPSMTRVNSLDFSNVLKRNSLGTAVAAGRFQMVTDIQQNSDDSE